ncbi:hypothetical protein [Arthrobacter sp. HMWF013]|uniref:hypothetical protein n=1 Tax=Arthrobacter sp. HMWF013 TaxID=2056849 RepID=UPI000D39115B|nr:hypothetical protein [Arthrobacter sp. HMWF013]PTT69322.1 hypothetical protein DBR22_04235 [Arthrobacter sp. HMWF013]
MVHSLLSNRAIQQQAVDWPSVTGFHIPVRLADKVSAVFEALKAHTLKKRWPLWAEHGVQAEDLFEVVGVSNGSELDER